MAYEVMQKHFEDVVELGRRIERLENIIADNFFPVETAVEMKVGRWKPEYGDTTYRVYAYESVCDHIWTGSTIDQSCYNHGNCFKTREEGKEHLKYLQALGRIRLYCEKEWYFVPNWEADSEDRCFIYYVNSEKVFNYNYHYDNYSMLLLPYLPSKQACKDVIAECEEDLRIIFKI